MEPRRKCVLGGKWPLALGFGGCGCAWPRQRDRDKVPVCAKKKNTLALCTPRVHARLVRRMSAHVERDVARQGNLPMVEHLRMPLISMRRVVEQNPRELCSLKTGRSEGEPCKVSCGAQIYLAVVRVLFLWCRRRSARSVGLRRRCSAACQQLQCRVNSICREEFFLHKALDSCVSPLFFWEEPWPVGFVVSLSQLPRGSFHF